MTKFGLIGKNIDYSFSKSYFTAKFEKENLPYTYENFDIDAISKFPDILQNHNLSGLNVTIPYKEQIIPYLDSIDRVAAQIGAINTIKFHPSGKIEGFNTDYYGFKKSLKPFLKSHHKRALILGTGGASKAVAHALKKLKIKFDYVSRNSNPTARYIYSNLTEDHIKNYQIIINCTPIGTFPNVNACPDIPYDGMSKKHLLYDLIYNPNKTKFLSCGEVMGAATCNGLKMLEYQAEKAWDIWNK